MARFETGSRHRKVPATLISIVIFIIIILVVCSMFGHFSTRSEDEQENALRLSLNQSIVHCYAVSGHYPESLDALLEYYNIHYDADRFFVDYEPQGENIIPDITIIRK